MKRARYSADRPYVCRASACGCRRGSYFGSRPRRQPKPKLSIEERMVAIVRQHGPISHLDLQRRCGLPRGAERILLIFGPYLEGACREFCQTFDPLVWRGVLRVVQLPRRRFRIAIGKGEQ